jgi:hypothetical protein
MCNIKLWEEYKCNKGATAINTADMVVFMRLLTLQNENNSFYAPNFRTQLKLNVSFMCGYSSLKNKTAA